MSATDRPTDEIVDPIAYFLEDVEHHGKSERTREYYGRVLRDFEAFLADQRGCATTADATHRDCMAYVHGLREEHGDSTVATYASYLHRFYDYMTRVDVFDGNPMTLVLEEMDESIDTDPARRELSIDQMRSFVAEIRHPLDRALVVTLLKTGMRVGELCNLDLRDLHLSDREAGSESNGDRAGTAGRDGDAGPVRPRLESEPNTIFVSPDPQRGSVVNGERRTASNKRMRGTVVPVDEELSRVLRRWLAVRPDPRSPASPLFVNTRSDWGSRLTTDVVHHVVEGHARERGWYREGGGATENVTPHYFRHFFTTHMRDRTGDSGVVKYLRGDVAQDVIDTYTHDWGGRIRDVYLENVYDLS